MRSFCTRREFLVGAASSGAALAAESVSADAEPRGVELAPVSGADGVFERVSLDGRILYRAAETAPGAYALYLYLKAPAGAPRRKGGLYVEATYKDVGVGALALEYNAAGESQAYQAATAYGAALRNTGEYRTAVFELRDADLRGAQNLGADMRLAAPGPGVRLHLVRATLYAEPTALTKQRSSRPWLRPDAGPARSDIDATTLQGKVVCGYQGWFRCPGDEEDVGWVHWSRDRSRIAPETLTFEMWPDMSEYSRAERYPAPGFTYPDGSQAELFSSANRRTVERHFDWMRRYGIDGVEVQRFVLGLQDPAAASRVLAYCRDAANRTGRALYVGYDLSGTANDRAVDLLTRDWRWLVDEMKLTADPRYLHERGKPVVQVFGFYPDRFGPELANRIIDVFQGRDRYAAYLIGSGPWNWLNNREPGWDAVYRRFDGYKPWNVGNWTRRNGLAYAATDTWAEALAETRRRGQTFLPVLYPGFSWDNLTRRAPGSSLIPRRGGEFLWDQFVQAKRLGVKAAFVAMFDEVDEGTAIFKVTNAAPVQGRFVTFEDKPSDWYLRLVGEGTKMLRGERPPTERMPIS